MNEGTNSTLSHQPYELASCVGTRPRKLTSDTHTEEIRTRTQCLGFSCFYLPNRCLSSVHPHPGLFHQTQQLLHVGTPVVHDVLRAPCLPEVYDPGRSVYSCPNGPRYDQPGEDFFGLLRGEIEEGGEAGEGDSGVVFGDDPDILREHDGQT